MLTASDVAQLPYVELLARLSESNRPPGGVATIRRLVSALNLRPGHNVLHAGCNAGFLSRELVRRSGARVVGIDINTSMVRAAAARAAQESVVGARYVGADMRALPFKSGAFDVVVSGGALAFVSGDRRRAVTEWMRVTKPHGLLANSEFFYAKQPPSDLQRELALTLGVEVPVYDLEYWLDLFADPRLERCYLHVETENLACSAEQILRYAEAMVARTSNSVAVDAREALLARLVQTFSLFNRNMAHLGFVIWACVVRPTDFEPSLYP